MVSKFVCYYYIADIKILFLGGLKMNEKFCQCCGIPMGNSDEMYGSSADSSKSEDYCKYCFENGTFTIDCTMDEMIEVCVLHMVTANLAMTEDEARKMMKEFFPTLKRWKTV